MQEFLKQGFLDHITKLSLQLLEKIECYKLKTNVLGLNITLNDFDDLYMLIRQNFQSQIDSISTRMRELITSLISTLKIIKIHQMRSLNQIIFRMRKKFSMDKFEPLFRYDNIVSYQHQINKSFFQYRQYSPQDKTTKYNKIQESLKNIQDHMKNVEESNIKVLEGRIQRGQNWAYFSNKYPNLGYAYRKQYKNFLKKTERYNEGFERACVNSFSECFINMEKYNLHIFDIQTKCLRDMEYLSVYSPHQIEKQMPRLWSERRVDKYKYQLLLPRQKSKVELVKVISRNDKSTHSVLKRNRMRPGVKFNDKLMIDKSEYELPDTSDFSPFMSSGKTTEVIKKGIQQNKYHIIPFQNYNNWVAYIFEQQKYTRLKTETIDELILVKRKVKQLERQKEEKMKELRERTKIEEERKNIESMKLAKEKREREVETQSFQQFTQSEDYRRIRKQQQRQDNESMKLENSIKNTEVYRNRQHELKQIQKKHEYYNSQDYKNKVFQEENLKFMYNSKSEKASKRAIDIQNQPKAQSRSFSYRSMKMQERSVKNYPKKVELLDVQQMEGQEQDFDVKKQQIKKKSIIKESNNQPNENKDLTFKNGGFEIEKDNSIRVMPGQNQNINMKKNGKQFTFKPSDFQEVKLSIAQKVQPKVDATLKFNQGQSIKNNLGQKSIQAKEQEEILPVLPLVEKKINPQQFYSLFCKCFNTQSQENQYSLHEIKRYGLTIKTTTLFPSRNQDFDDSARSFFTWIIKEKMFLEDPKLDEDYMFKGPDIIVVDLLYDHQDHIEESVGDAFESLKQVKSVVIYANDIIQINKVAANKQKMIKISYYYFEKEEKEIMEKYQYQIKKRFVGFVVTFQSINKITLNTFKQTKEFLRINLIMSLCLPDIFQKEQNTIKQQSKESFPVSYYIMQKYISQIIKNGYMTPGTLQTQQDN